MKFDLLETPIEKQSIHISEIAFLSSKSLDCSYQEQNSSSSLKKKKKLKQKIRCVSEGLTA